MRSLEDLLNGDDEHEREIARRLCTRFGSNAAWDRQFRSAEALWEDMVRVWLRDREHPEDMVHAEASAVATFAVLFRQEDGVRGRSDAAGD